MTRINLPPGYDDFVRNAEPRLRRAYLGIVGVDLMPDAVAEALGPVGSRER